MSLNIVIPAHNEQHRIGPTLADYRSRLKLDQVTFTVALDDCTDRTRAVVQAHADADPRVRFVEYPRLGKGGVIAEAFRSSTSELVAFIDADCATPPEALAVLVTTLLETDADIAVASRWHPASVLPGQRPWKRRLASIGFASAVKQIFDLPVLDTQCGAKVMRTAVAHRILPLVSSRDFVFDVDLLFTARSLGFSIAEAPTVWLDQDGSRVRMGRDTLRMAASLGRLWLHHRVVPIHMAHSEIEDAAGDGVVGLHPDRHDQRRVGQPRFVPAQRQPSVVAEVLDDAV